MAGLAGIRAGNAGAASRDALIRRMEETAASGVYQWEVTRRARVVRILPWDTTPITQETLD